MRECATSAETHPPIFVFGTARSGTTLTYSLLLASGCFPSYAAESRILECASRYGALRSKRNRRAFLNDFLRSRQFSRSGLTEEQVTELVATRSGSYVDFLDGFMDAIARNEGKPRWVEKSPNNAYFVDQVAKHYSHARFVHVIRDGRAVVASQRKLGWGRKYARAPRDQLIWIGSVWALQVEAGRRAARLGPDRYLEIRYEDVIQSPSATLERLGRFTGVDLDLEAVTRSGVGALGDSNTAFSLDEGGIAQGALRRWMKTLEPEEITLLDWQLGDLLRDLGYQADSAAHRPTVRDGFTAAWSRLALETKRMLNFHTPLGRFARVPLEIGLP